MCNLYEQATRQAVETSVQQLGLSLAFEGEPQAKTVGPFGSGLFLRPSVAGLVAQVGQWGMIRPGQAERVPERRYQTNNARIETVADKPTFRAAWRAGRRCLVPAAWYAEPNWETGRNIWWHLRRADGQPWFLAGLWSEWVDPVSGEMVPNYTVLTCNCDTHTLLSRLHKPDPKVGSDQQDKRSLIHIAPQDWAQWLNGSTEQAMRLVRAEEAGAFDQGDAHKADELLANMRGGSLF